MSEVHETGLKAIPTSLAPHIIGGGWVATLVGGRILQSKGTAEMIPLEYRVLAADMLQLLGVIHHGGQWVAGWTDIDAARGVPRRFIMSWIDRDGDLQFIVDCEDRFEQIALARLDLVAQCEAAFQHYLENLRALDLREDQKIKAVLGERSKDPSAMPDYMANVH